MESSSRRKFLKAGGLGVTGILSSSIISQASSLKKLKAPEKLTILFQGDSITDAGRDKAKYYSNDTAGMGRGYVFSNCHSNAWSKSG